MYRLAHNLFVLYRRIINKIMRTVGKTIYFENAYGIKAYAKPQFILMKDVKYDLIDIVPSTIHLSFDALKDEYSHVGIPLSESPHVELVKTLKEKEDIRTTSYYKKEINGRLDGRYELPDSQMLIDTHIAASKKINKRYPIIYKADNTYYVLDGKHRLATALIEKQPNIKCIEISPSVIAQDKYTLDILKRMRKKPEKYSRNIQHINSLI